MAWDDLTNPEAWKQSLANLLRKGEDVGSYIATAPEKVGQAILSAGQRQSALMNEAFDPTGKTLIRNPQAANQAAMNLFEGPLSFAPAGITAWHGSPHSFEKFDMSKVGTGEGAQAYGHGMYFAESPNVAKGYQESTTAKFTGGNAKELPDNAWDELGTVMQKHNIPGDVMVGLDEPKQVRLMLNKYADKLNPEEKKVFEKWASAPEGNLYKVDIPDEHIPHMLDWDKPLSEQSKSVQDALAKYDFDLYHPKGSDYDPMERGQDVYHRIASILAYGKPDTSNVYKEASDLLNKSGITGIKYLDQGSRGTGGTSNFVVFDPSTVQILERNNQPLSRKEVIEEQLNKLK